MPKNKKPTRAKSWDRVLDKNNKWSLDGFVRTMHDYIVYEGIGNPWRVLLDIGPGVPNSEAWIFREYSPDLEIIGFEPQTERYNFLKSIYPGTLSKLAVTGHTGVVNGKMGFEDGESDFKINLATDDQAIRYQDAIVNCKTVDDILFDNNRWEVFVWADIEGGELDMLRGCVKSMLYKRINFIALELNFIKDALAIIEFLRRFDYYPIGTSSNFTGMVDLGGDFSICTEHKINDEDTSADFVFARYNVDKPPLGPNYFTVIDNRTTT